MNYAGLHLSTISDIYLGWLGGLEVRVCGTHRYLIAVDTASAT